jgi:hypothetical protein
MPITQSTHSYAFDETVSEIAFQENYESARQGIGLYSIRGSAGPRVVSASFGGIGLLQKKSESEAYSTTTPQQERKKEFIHDAYTAEVSITREAADDDIVGLAQSIGEELGSSGAHTEEYWAVDLFNDLFDGARHTGEDNVAICYDTHTNADGSNSQDNKTTNTLTYANLKSARIAMRGILPYNINRKMIIAPNEIVAGLQLEEDVWQLVRTMGKPGTANNDMNFFAGYVGYILQWSSWTTQWAIMDSRLRQKYLRWYQRVGLEILSDATFSQGNRKMGAYMRFSLGCTDWRWVYGGTGGA